MQKTSSKNYEVITLDIFEREAKHLIKKYPSLNIEIPKLLEKLEEYPFQGEPIGNDCFKIRISISSKGKGKSGGGRIITNVMVSLSKVFCLSIYDKSESESISKKEILNRLKKLPR